MSGLLGWLHKRLAQAQGRAAGLAERGDPVVGVPASPGAAAAFEADPPTSPIEGLQTPVMATLTSPLALYRAGRAADAETAAHQALADDASHPDGTLVLALLAIDRGQPLDALRRLSSALEAHGGHPGLLSAHGRAMAAAGRRKEAWVALEHARTVVPASGEPLLELARLALAGRREPEAFELLVSATTREPSLADAHLELGNLLRARGQLDQALSHFQQAVAHDPMHAQALNNLGSMHRDRGLYDKAAAAFERALALRPDLVAAAYNLGMVRVAQKRWGDAVGLLQAYVARHAKDADAQYWLGNASMALGLDGEARKAYVAAVSANADHVAARWGFAMAQLPAVASSSGSQDAAPDNFRREVAKMRTWFRNHPNAEGQRAVGAQQPFYLAYIAQNHRAVLSEYGSLSAQLMAGWARKVGAPKPLPSPGPRCRVGIVSSHIHTHSVWNAI